MLIPLLANACKDSTQSDTKTTELSSEETDSNKRTSKNTENSKPKIKKLQGNGFEPSWDMLISRQNNEKYNFELITQEGLDTLRGYLSLQSSSLEGNNLEMTFGGEDNSGYPISVTYKSEHCLNMAGDDVGGSMEIKWKDKRLKDCAHYALEESN